MHTGLVTTIAGQKTVAGPSNGFGTNAKFDNPQFMALTSTGKIYVADNLNGKIRLADTAGASLCLWKMCFNGVLIPRLLRERAVCYRRRQHNVRGSPCRILQAARLVQRQLLRMRSRFLHARLRSYRLYSVPLLSVLWSYSMFLANITTDLAT